MRRVTDARPVKYENGFIVSRGEPVQPTDLDWIEKTGYEITETGIKGWGGYNAIITVNQEMESLTCLARLAEVMITKVDLVLPRDLRAKLSNTAYDEGTSEADVVTRALSEFLDRSK